MRKLTILLALAIGSKGFAHDIENISTEWHLRTGYRWDRVTTSGSMENISITPAPTGQVDGEQISRDLRNINLWNFEVGASAVFDHFVTLSGRFAYGIFIDHPTEIFSGHITNNQGYTKLYVGDLTNFSSQDFSLDSEVSIGTKLTIFNDHITCIPRLGLGVYKLSITVNNNMLTWGGFFGISLFYPLKHHLTLSAGYRYHFKGSRKERIEILAKDGITFEKGTLSNGGFHGSSLDASIQWKWAKRWTLDLSWEFRYLWTSPAASSAFGGTAFLKTSWLSQNIGLALKYDF